MNNNFDIPLDVLAASVEEVASICDIKTALLLVEHFGGCRIWVPQKWREGHDLNVIGEIHAKLLIDKMGGGEINIPRRPFSHHGLHIMIERLQSAGKSQREIALTLGIAMKTIRDHKKGLRKNKKGSKCANHSNNQIDLEDYLKSA